MSKEVNDFAAVLLALVIGLAVALEPREESATPEEEAAAPGPVLGVPGEAGGAANGTEEPEP